MLTNEGCLSKLGIYCDLSYILSFFSPRLLETHVHIPLRIKYVGMFLLVSSSAINLLNTSYSIDSTEELPLFIFYRFYECEIV